MKELYLKSPRAYFYHYHLYLREKKMGSALFFGSLIEKGLDVLFKGGTLEQAIETFKKNFKTTTVNNKVEDLSSSSNIRYSKADLDLDVFTEKEIEDLRRTDPRIDAKEVERREQSILNNATLRQQLMDKCVQITEPTELGIVVPREIPVREVKLKSQERSESYINQGVVSPADTAQRAPVKKSIINDESSFEGAVKVE